MDTRLVGHLRVTVRPLANVAPMRGIINPKFGTAHVFDADNTLSLNLTYCGILESHNTTLISVTWIETLEGGNYTNSPLVGLNISVDNPPYGLSIRTIIRFVDYSLRF
ncbi:hypothetical protein EAF04_004403 [Stromatinia cepivora]|nr:hypothetical protein EAF04_004403 [Stromatinia cepivora]